jgi:glycosyltransferase involved in cell wall biosynthesis
MKRIAVLVSNDLQHDQRVAKVCGTLHQMGGVVTLVGRKLPNSPEYTGPYQAVRFQLPFHSGALFYAALNVRLFFYLLFTGVDIIVANDLDTLLPAFLIAKLRRKKLVYDSHEYFTEAEGLTGRNFQKSVWLGIEKWIFPRLENVITVNESIADIYRNLYHVPVHVVRNVPLLRMTPPEKSSRTELNLPPHDTIVLLQGAYIDPDRGGMELVEAFQSLSDCILLVIGAGRDYANMQRRAHELGLSNVRFLGRLPYAELMRYTSVADIGVSLDKPLHLNYTLSLPNKLFDYIHAGIPVLVSDLPELRKVVHHYDLGRIVSEVSPAQIARCIEQMKNQAAQKLWRLNTGRAKNELNWQQESKVIQKIYGPLFNS